MWSWQSSTGFNMDDLNPESSLDLNQNFGHHRSSFSDNEISNHLPLRIDNRRDSFSSQVKSPRNKPKPSSPKTSLKYFFAFSFIIILALSGCLVYPIVKQKSHHHKSSNICRSLSSFLSLTHHSELFNLCEAMRKNVKTFNRKISSIIFPTIGFQSLVQESTNSSCENTFSLCSALSFLTSISKLLKFSLNFNF